MFEASTSIRRVCDETGIPPEELLAHLLDNMLEGHRHVGISSGLGWSGALSIVDEVSRIISRAGRRQTPDSIMAALQLHFESEFAMNARQSGSCQQAESERLLHKAVCDKALIAIFREGMHEVEKEGLAAGTASRSEPDQERREG